MSAKSRLQSLNAQLRSNMLLATILLFAGDCAAQLPSSLAAAPAPTAPIAVSLTEAIQRAQANAPLFAAATAENKALALDRSIARAALLPTVVYHNQFLYTQSNGVHPAGQPLGTPSLPIFIANNGVHEYVSQGSVNETIGVLPYTAVQRATAISARATAELEISRRGLVATVVSLYFGSLASEKKLAVAQRAAIEADTFTSLTQKRESAREAAHADVVKAQLQQQQRQRDLADAQLLSDRSRLELGLLLFPDPRTAYTLQRTDITAALPTRSEIESAAARMNPELKSAMSTLRLSNIDILSARAAYLPDLTLNFSYGIDAAQFAANGPDGARNLGYSATATVDIPVWNWLSTQNKIKQTQIRRDAARIALTATQKRLIASLDEFYAEAASVQTQLASLDSSVQTAAESLRLTRLRYTSGEATVLEVVDAQNALTAVENAREDGAVRYQTALANLQTLTGTL